MKYRRKSDGVIVDAKGHFGWTGDNYKIEEKTPNFVYVYWVNRRKFERDYEEIKEEKPMFTHPITAPCEKCGIPQIYLHGQEAPVCKDTARCDERLKRKAPPLQEIKLNLGEGYQKPMRNFKVGDRVVFYSGIRNKGIIIEIGNQIIVRQDRKDIQQETVGLFYLHPKQCRKLKKREVRRAWVCPDFIQRMNNDFDGLLGIKGKPQEGWTEFVEVRKK